MSNTNDSLEVSSAEESENSCKHLMYKTVGGYSAEDSGFKVCIPPFSQSQVDHSDLLNCSRSMISVTWWAR